MQEKRAVRYFVLMIVLVLVISGCVPSGVPMYGHLRGFVGIPIKVRGASLGESAGIIDPQEVVVSSSRLDPEDYYPLAGARVTISGESGSWQTDKDGMFYAYSLRTGYKTVTISHRALRTDVTERIRITEGYNTLETFGGIGYYLIVGIENYRQLSNYPGAGRDADGVYQVFNEHTQLPGYLELLKDSRARKNNIKSAILAAADLASARDYFVLYFAGHMGRDFLSPYDSDGNNWSTEITDGELESWLRRFPGYVTVILDGGESATFADGEIHSLALKRSNYTVISSARKGQEDVFAFPNGHGLFTHYLIAGLSTPEERRKADSNRDGIITAQEIYNYVKNGMWSQAGNKQVPQLYVGSTENTVILRYER
ncbi:MAG: caspase family protein [Firmicutes bacterium]|nr:caspase family protein [Bacillota bacterium]